MRRDDLQICFDHLTTCDLSVGAIYRATEDGSIGGEPINRLLRCGNMGGFRIRGSIKRNQVRLVALYTTFGDQDWPDRIDRRSGRFVYYGDNKSPGQDLHQTPRHGNELLRRVFGAVHSTERPRALVPPFFVFSSAPPGRSVRFHGVAAPGAPDVPEPADLVATWNERGASRFQNYCATFTILDVDPVPRLWIDELLSGEALGSACPAAWRRWIDEGEYEPLSERAD